MDSDQSKKEPHKYRVNTITQQQTKTLLQTKLLSRNSLAFSNLCILTLIILAAAGSMALYQRITLDANLNSKQQQRQDSSSVGVNSRLLSSSQSLFPKKAWLYSSTPVQAQTPLVKRIIANNMQILEHSHYSVEIVDSLSLPSLIKEKIKEPPYQAWLELIEKDHGAQFQLTDFRKTIESTKAMLLLLKEHGGVFIDQGIVLTEKLDWLNDIQRIEFLNGKLVSSPKVFGYLSVEHSSEVDLSQVTKQNNNKPVFNEPAMLPDFMAAEKNSSFISQLYHLFNKLLHKPQMFKSQVKKLELNQKIFTVEKADKALFFLAQRILLTQTVNKADSALPYQQYSLATFNEFVGPNRLMGHLGSVQVSKIYNHLSMLPLEELRSEVGPLRSMVKLSQLDKLNSLYVESLTYQTIVKDSFIYRYLLPLDNRPAVYEEKLHQGTQSVPWSSLPAKLWVLLDKQLEQSTLLTQVWAEHIKHVANQSSFEVIFLSQAQAYQYINDLTPSSIEATHSSRFRLDPTLRRQILMLAVIVNNGGVAISEHTLLFDNLQWLTEIGKEPFVWNKYGETPEVVMPFNPRYGGPFTWSYDREAGTKLSDSLAFDMSFIAAIPNSPLLAAWLDQILSNLRQPTYGHLDYRLVSCKSKDISVESNKEPEELVLENLRCVLQRKNQRLAEQRSQKKAVEQYRLWGINGFNSLYKLREFTNYLKGMHIDNPYIWAVSSDEVKHNIGEFGHFARIYPQTARLLQQKLIQNNGNLTAFAHPNSICIKYLVEPCKQKVVISEGRTVLQIYTKEQTLKDMPPIIWVSDGNDLDHSDPLVTMRLQNIKSYASKSHFDVRFITQNNFNQWLPLIATDRVRDFTKRVKFLAETEFHNFKDHSPDIIRRYTLLSLLYQSGGVMIFSECILLRDLSWLTQLHDAKLFSFYSSGYSSKKTFVTADRYESQNPSLEYFMIASVPKSKFIKKFLYQFETLTFELDDISYLSHNRYADIGELTGKDRYYEGFFMTSHFVLQDKRTELRAQNDTSLSKDYYRMRAIDSTLDSFKLEDYLRRANPSTSAIKVYTSLITKRQLEARVGPLNYTFFTNNYRELKKIISDSLKNRDIEKTLQGSLMHHCCLFDQETDKIVNYQYEEADPESKWKSLPQKLWVFPTNIDKDASKILLKGMQKVAQESNFKFRIVDDSTRQQVIPEKWRNKMKQIKDKGDNEQVIRTLEMLAVLKEHGGVAVQGNYLLTQPLAWFSDITKYDPANIFNRFGKHPKVLLFVNEFANNHNWTYNYKAKTKVGHSLGYSADIIASEKGAELVSEWMGLLVDQYSKDRKEQSAMLRKCGLTGRRGDGLDSLHCLINHKQKELEEKKEGNPRHACEMYGLWSVSESLGINKMSLFNHDKRESSFNHYLWFYSLDYVETIIGKVEPAVRFSRRQLDMLDDHIRQAESRKQLGVKGSILYEYLQSKLGDLQWKNGRLVLPA